MALITFAKQAVAGLGLRCGASLAPLVDSSVSLRSLAVRGYASVVDGLKYAKDHEWVKVDGDTALVGITDFAQAELGDLVYVELPEVGATVTVDERFGVVESVKAASDINSPISGEVLEVNSALADDSSKVNSDPYGEGWMIKVKLSDAGELGNLMGAKDYEAHCAE